MTPTKALHALAERALAHPWARAAQYPMPSVTLRHSGFFWAVGMSLNK